MSITIAAYKVEIVEDGCRECGKGAQWAVIGPDDVAGATTYDEQSAAQDEADLCNQGFAAGIAYADNLFESGAAVRTASKAFAQVMHEERMNRISRGEKP